jgi:hypothetical protein
MDLKDNLEIINNLERTQDISEYRFKDFNYWPIMRSLIYFRALTDSSSSQVKDEDNKKSEKLKIIFLKVFNLINVVSRIRRESIPYKRFAFFLTSGHAHLGSTGNYKHDYVDDFADRFDIGDVNYFYVNDKILSSIRFENEKEWIDISSLYWTRTLFYRCKFLLSSHNKELSKEIGKKEQRMIRNIHELSKIYEKVLKKSRPKLVFLICFYTLNSFAITLACHRLNIKVVEYQHGAQNDCHNMYTNWKRPPKEGYEIIPDYFWMWGDISRKRIENWASKTSKHVAFVGGNSSLLNAKNRRRVIKEEIIKSDKKIVLVSLQHEKFLPHWFVDFCIDHKDEFSWVFRQHPRNKLSKETLNVLASISDIPVDVATDTNKYDLLTISDIHITGFSSMAFEALFFNTPTIFVNENALNGYRKLIDDRSFYYASNREEMYEKLNAVQSCTFEDTVKYFAREEDLCFSSLGDLENYFDNIV